MRATELYPDEHFWVDHYDFFYHRGYQLRPRYRPGHVSSRKRGQKRPWFELDQFEDEIATRWTSVLDAVRLTDGSTVVLRRTHTWTDEIPIHLYLAHLTPKDERNHVVPVLDIITFPETDEVAFLVLPLLHLYYDPAFTRPIQATQALQQFFEAMQFLHEHDIAHRDFCRLNLMMDASELIPGGFHFVAATMTPDGLTYGLNYLDRADVSPVRYFVIDLGLASHFPSRRLNGSDCLVTGVYGQDKTVPELSWEKPYDPFKVDIYQLGRVILEDMIEEYADLAFLRPLAESMTQQDPSLRPDACTAVTMLKELVNAQDSDALQQPMPQPYSQSGLIFTPRPPERCCEFFCSCEGRTSES
ncbi:hypothetical protein BD626DRAFT_474686 [Schizophyllum amplum]|uniref:Protein kinase domain-containing protein n=1 Tax=Schizophyllum amplum TaxID=97359 RepID=A0A550CXS7_9AGAR|nr:hypothetical protein BD626DRAFT_474686 [Auriculariopsis ampla]